MSNKYYEGGNPPFRMQTYKRKRTRDEQQMEERRSMAREERDVRSRLRKLMTQMEAIKKAVLKKDGTFKEYGSARNTSGGGPVMIGDEVRPEGKPGPRGPQGVKGDKGDTGDIGGRGLTGLDGNADFMILEGVSGNTNAFGLTTIKYKIYGSMDMLASPNCKRFTFTSGPFNYRGFSLLFRPGVYEVSVNFTEKNTSWYLIQFDLDNDHQFADEAMLRGNTNVSSGQPVDFHRTFVVPHVANFYLAEWTSSTVGDWDNNAPQVLFKRIGDVEPSGSDDVLSIISGATQTDDITVTGGIYWNTPAASPPAGYHPNDHPSNGGTNEWAVIEQAADSGSSVLSWIHRIKRFI